MSPPALDLHPGVRVFFADADASDVACMFGVQHWPMAAPMQLACACCLRRDHPPGHLMSLCIVVRIPVILILSASPILANPISGPLTPLL